MQWRNIIKLDNDSYWCARATENLDILRRRKKKEEEQNNDIPEKTKRRKRPTQPKKVAPAKEVSL